ncbi:MAG: RNA 2',3'-cyclic phosphodiesterase [Phaeospirillum sp.]|nr:RNA 2',3'-cyclic phosphodiesterase [Phaeospirillum sp.]
MIRLFTAIELPPELAGRLAAQGFGLPGARFVPARNLHLTLRFIGEVDEAAAEEVHTQLTSVTAPPFTLTLTGLGLFGDRHRAHTLWQGVERSDALGLLAGRVEAAVVRAGQPPETRKFSPHITLARIKETSPARIQAFISAVPPHHADSVPVDGFCLFRSTLTRGGPEYDVLERYPLG